MKQITEDYVSEEVAKLLQMKGFDEPCDSYYEWFESRVTLYKGYMPEFYHGRYKPVSDMLHLKRPTHQMALKWLREVHSIHIIPYFDKIQPSDLPYSFAVYIVDEYTATREIIACFDIDENLYWGKQEQAIEAALKYTLENLI